MKRLLISATGGHLTELVELADRLRPSAVAEHWVTFDSAQSRHLLAGRQVTYVRPTMPRDVYGVVANLRAAERTIRRWTPDEVVSNGAGIALSFLPLARAHGLPAHYIECSARTDGPSLTGRLLARVPGIRLYTQDPAWSDHCWCHAGSIFDGYRPVVRAAPQVIRRVFVTVGSLDFSYMRLMKRLPQAVPAGAEVVIQAGSDADDVRWPEATVRRTMTPAEIEEELNAADVVVAHSGIGSAIDALKAGKCPVLVPRRHRHREHVDEHQFEIASRLRARGLAILAGGDNLGQEHLEQAAARAVESEPQSVVRLRA